MDEKIRCFISINLPEKLKEEIIKIQQELEEKNLFFGKFTEPENLHLTLKFLGEISEERVEEVKRELKELKFGKFKAGFGRLGVFSERFIRIIWIEILGKQVFDLQSEIDGKMKEIGFKKEERFMSHLTIARVKKVEDRERLLKELREIGITLEKKDFIVDKFFLMKSTLREKGPFYEILEEYELVS